MRLADIQLAGNEHGELRRNTMYACLYDDDGHLVISATLDYILVAIRERGYNVEGVTVGWEDCRGTKCSTVTLDKYVK